jgi:hypothetical protein
VKFGAPRGGKSVLFHVELLDHLPILILTEGEWDTMLMWEHCADLCDAGTIGGAQSKFDVLDLALLTRSKDLRYLCIGRRFLEHLQCNRGHPKCRSD